MESPDYIFDDRSEGYRAVGDLLAHVATRCGVEVDDVTAGRWRDALGLVREFDTYADEYCSDRHEAIAALRDYTLFEDQYPTLSPHTLGKAVFTSMLGNVRNILYFSELISQETDTDKYIELRKLEAYYTVMAIGSAATPDVHGQDMYPTFIWRITGIGIGANLADSFLDARADYVDCKAKLEPTFSFYGQVLAEGWRHAKPHIPFAMDPKGVGIRAGIIGRRFAHRITHGVTPHSNLRNISAFWRRRPVETQSEL